MKAKISKPGEVEIIQPKQGIWRTYDATDGLPGGVWCLLQDRRGFLWLGTEVGLCRYDGAEFITYTTADGLAHNYVYTICEDREGRLWLGTRGGGVSCFDGQNFTNYTMADGLANDYVSAVYEDSQGQLWFGTDGGVSCFDGQGFINYTTIEGLGHNTVQAICEDRKGRLWFGTGWWDKPGRGASCFDGQNFITYSTENGLPHDSVMAIYEDRQGHLWFATCGGGVSRLNDQEFVTYTIEDGLVINHVLAICEDRQGRLWFGAFGGISCFDRQDFVNYTTEDGLLDNRVLDIVQDREGLLWFANISSGLTRLDTKTLQLLTEEPVSETLIQDRQDGLWFDRGYELCYLKEGQLHRRDPVFTASLLEDSNGGIWVGTFGEGLYYFDSPDSVWICPGKNFTTEDGLSGKNFVTSLMETRDGTIWAGTEGTLWAETENRFGCLCRAVYSDPIAKSVQGQRDVIAFEAITTPYGYISLLFEDSRGRLYIGGSVWAGGGMGGGGLSHYDMDKPGHLYDHTTEGGLVVDSVISLVEDDSGNLWIGTSQGLYCYDGKQFALYGKEQGLSCLDHRCSTKDANGQLWFGTLGGGIYRHDGRYFQMLTVMDGLPSNSITGLVPQSDGSMIIGTHRGIVHYHPTANLPPSVEIREVVADEVYQNPIELELTTTETRLLTISYHGLSFASCQMRYSYILEGYDEEWRDTWERQVRYENLPVGEYTFKVIVINRDLVPSEIPATLKLNVVPDPRDMRVKELESDLIKKNRQLALLQSEVGRKYQFDSIVGESEAIKWLRAMMEKAIDLGRNVLIIGETGTGKELVAKAIHFNSSRKNGPLRALHWGEVSKDLIPSTLFGYRKGAFTGATEDTKGYFEEASGGTLLLDEIGDMPEDIQVRFLRVLEEGVVIPIGEREARDVNVRIIAMTNRNLDKDMEVGRFRRDLYHRLNGFRIDVPPLRDRPDDIPLLAEHFYQEAYRDLGKKVDGFAPEVMDMLQRCPWPGNVRELRNEIHQAYVIAEAETPIQVYHFSPQVTHKESLMQEVLSEQLGLSASLKRLQIRMIEEALRETGGNRTHAAKRLGMDVSNLRRKIRELKIKI
ncbi:two-component regulator propeller domain-containing protein [Candidatus Poribacteria bacterium]